MDNSIETYGLSASDVAKWFICNLDREAGDSITHLKLQKLIYYSQAWSLAINKKALFEEDFEAWARGPVIPAVYHMYKDHGFDALPSCECKHKIHGDVENIFREVKRVYGEMSARKLESLTHSEQPWIEARGKRSPEVSCAEVIPKENLIEYYSLLLDGQA